MKISHLLMPFILLPLIHFGQDKQTPTKTELTKVYIQAISDFIKAANKKNKTSFDTLFFGKRVNGQTDDFPDILLPNTLENTQIRLISPELGEKKQKARPSTIYINLIGWVTKEDADFMFVVFSNGFKHQYDYALEYTFDIKMKKWNLNKLEFKGPPFGK